MTVSRVRPSTLLVLLVTVATVTATAGAGAAVGVTSSAPASEPAASTSDAAQTPPTLRAGSATVAAGGNVTVPVTLSSAPEGVLAINDLTITSTNASVARPVGFAVGDFPADQTGVESRTNDSITVGAADLAAGDQVPVTSEEVVVGYVVLDARTLGTTDLNVSVGGVLDDSRNEFVPPVANGSLTVADVTADAGADRTVASSESVSLDATGSTIPDGVAASYNWTQVGGPNATIAGARTARPTVTAPLVTTETTLTFEVTVAGRDVDRVTLTVLPGDAPTLGADTVRGPVGSNVTVPITLSSAPTGVLAARNVTVRVANTSVARPVAVRPGDFPTDQFDATIAGDTVTIGASDLAAGDQVAATDGPVVVGVIVLNASAIGNTTAVVEDGEVLDDSRAPVPLAFGDGTVTVTEQPFAERSSPPTDPDPDKPGFEDYNGDNVLSFKDVIDYLFEQDPSVTGVDRDAVDYNDDGEIDIRDVIALLFRSTS